MVLDCLGVGFGGVGFGIRSSRAVEDSVGMAGRAGGTVCVFERRLFASRCGRQYVLPRCSRSVIDVCFVHLRVLL